MYNNFPTRQLQETIGVRSEYWIQNSALGAPIGEQDTNKSSDDWHLGYQGNELSIYIVLLAGYQIGIRGGASSI
jgi:hypothetical protein